MAFTNSNLFIHAAFRRRSTDKDNSPIGNPIGGSINAFEKDDKRTICKISKIECSTDKDLQSTSLSDNRVKAMPCSVSSGSSNIL